MSEASPETVSGNDERDTGKARKLSDWQRFRQAGTYHGIAALALLSLFAAADTWYVTTGLMVANIISILNALVAGAFLASLFHEWGHFSGARLAKSYSPIVREVKGIFMFGFSYEKNTSNQFLSMSMGGPAGNWLLVALVFIFLPMDTPGRVTLLAMVVAKAVSVCVFEIPIILNTRNGGDPESEVNRQLSNGAGDRGSVMGYLTGAVLWLIAI